MAEKTFLSPAVSTREIDLSQLENLGPIIRAMSFITAMAEKCRDHDDIIKNGL